MLVLAAVLLLIFHAAELKQFWHTEISTTGHYARATFFRQNARNLPLQVPDLNVRQLQSHAHSVTYQLARPQNVQIYLRPILARQSGVLDHERKAFHYKNLKQLKLRLSPRLEQTLFHVNQHTTAPIHLNPYLQEGQPTFQLILDNSGGFEHSERVIGSLELFVVDNPMNDAIPMLPLFMVFLLAPVIWAVFLHQGLDIPLPQSLGLSCMALLLAHIAWLLLPDLIFILMVATVLSCLLLLLLQHLLEARPLPHAPFFWGLLWLGAWLRWQEILVRATVPLEDLPRAAAYYQHSLSMDLFSETGFFAANLTHAPLYPFLLKLTGWLFGFSPFHMLYLSLLGGLLLLVLSYYLARQLLGTGLAPLLVMGLASINGLLIRESGLRSPDIFSACLTLLYLLLVFASGPRAMLRGVLRGLILLLLIWNHLSFLPLACGLVLLDVLYQTRRSQGSVRLTQSLRGGVLSVLILLAGFLPCFYQNWQRYTTVLPETTAYVSRIANLEFSDHYGFPSSLEIIQKGLQAPQYQQLGLREYFLDLHSPAELAGSTLLGSSLIMLDSIGAMLNLSSGENILSVLVQGLSSKENLLPIVVLFLLEIFAALLLVVFGWRRFLRYRMLLLVLLLMMLPHTFFYGVFMLKGLSLMQSQLDHQLFLVYVPVLSLMLIDALRWLRQDRARWLR